VLKVLILSKIKVPIHVVILRNVCGEMGMKKTVFCTLSLSPSVNVMLQANIPELVIGLLYGLIILHIRVGKNPFSAAIGRETYFSSKYCYYTLTNAF